MYVLTVLRAADLLLGGAVMNKGFQPHESHIPYTLQVQYFPFVKCAQFYVTAA